LLAKLAAAVCRHPGWFFYPQIALFIACIIYTVLFLQFDTSRDNLVGSNEKISPRIILTLKRNFPNRAISWSSSKAKTSKKTGQFAERIGAKFGGGNESFYRCFLQGDLPRWAQRLFYLCLKRICRI